MSDAEIYFQACKKQNPWAYQVEYPQIPDRFLPTNEDKLNLLRGYDTVFLVDDSQSMLHVDQGATAWILCVNVLHTDPDLDCFIEIEVDNGKLQSQRNWICFFLVDSNVENLIGHDLACDPSCHRCSLR